MTSPQPSSPPTGQITLIALIAYLESLVTSTIPVAQTVISDAIEAFHVLENFLDPAAGRETQRETTLATALKNKDLPGLYAFWNRMPREPNKPLAICESYIKLLGGIVPPVPTA